jgi:hypothetical protein
MVSIIIGKPTVLLQPTHMLYAIILEPVILFHCTGMLYITIGKPTLLLHHTHMLYIILGKPILILPSVSMLYDNNVSLQPSYVFPMSINNVLSLLMHFVSILAIFWLNHLNRFLLFDKKFSRNFCFYAHHSVHRESIVKSSNMMTLLYSILFPASCSTSLG